MDNSSHLTTLVLYDSALGSTPDRQGRLHYLTSPGAAAVQMVVDGATTLDSSPNQSDAAGYMLAPTYLPLLDRSSGYALEWTLQVLSETHADSDKNGDGVGDRAGFSVIVLSDDLYGIELGFWPDQIWAQEDGTAEPPHGTLFTHAEGSAFDTTQGLIHYSLAIQDDTYRLSSNETTILRGALRRYTSFKGPVNPYRTPNFVFLGDDSGSAQAIIRLAYVSMKAVDHGAFGS